MGVKCYECLLCFSRENDGKDMALRYRMFRHTHMATYWEHIATDGSSLMALDRPGKYAALTPNIVAYRSFIHIHVQRKEAVLGWNREHRILRTIIWNMETMAMRNGSKNVLVLVQRTLVTLTRRIFPRAGSKRMKHCHATIECPLSTSLSIQEPQSSKLKPLKPWSQQVSYYLHNSIMPNIS